jgi:hypothetical protein
MSVTSSSFSPMSVSIIPAFIPSSVVSGSASKEEDKGTKTGIEKQRKAGGGINSDTSTEVGESEADDDQDLMATTAYVSM